MCIKFLCAPDIFLKGMTKVKPKMEKEYFFPYYVATSDISLRSVVACIYYTYRHAWPMHKYLRNLKVVQR
jgi:hypothetical protein